MRRTVLFARRLSRSRHGQAGLFALSAAETVFLPLVLEAIMAPMMLVDRLGAWLYGWVGQDLVALAGGEAAFEDFKFFMQAHGFWAILVAGLTPIPFQLAVLASGVTGYSLPGFVAAVLIARSIRYLGMAALVAWLGADAFRAFSRLRRIAPWRRTRASGHEVAQAIPEHGEYQSRRAQDAPAGERRVG